jgi:hypothetical protein
MECNEIRGIHGFDILYRDASLGLHLCPNQSFGDEFLESKA